MRPSTEMKPTAIKHSQFIGKVFKRAKRGDAENAESRRDKLKNLKFFALLCVLCVSAFLPETGLVRRADTPCASGTGF